MPRLGGESALSLIFLKNLNQQYFLFRHGLCYTTMNLVYKRPQRETNTNYIVFSPQFLIAGCPQSFGVLADVYRVIVHRPS